MMCKKRYCYAIAGLEIWVDEDLPLGHAGPKEWQQILSGFNPFLREEESESKPVLSVSLCHIESKTGSCYPSENAECKQLHSFEFNEGQAECRFLCTDDNEENHLILSIEQAGSLKVDFSIDRKLRRLRCIVDRRYTIATKLFASMLKFGIWFAFGIEAAARGIAAIHSSTIVYDGKAVMFLGESGTGKSTHTRLWLKQSSNSSLLNDDSPFIGVSHGCPIVYGSPWSGKTPCYKDEFYPLRAIVRLSQAPHNRIYRQKGALAIGALLPSFSPAFMFDERLKEHILILLTKILATTEVYHLECLPNDEAAELVRNELFGQ